MRQLWWQLKQFFAAFPAPGSWAYRWTTWLFNNREKKEKHGHVKYVQRNGTNVLKVDYTGSIDHLNWDLWALVISGNLLDIDVDEPDFEGFDD